MSMTPLSRCVHTLPPFRLTSEMVATCSDTFLIELVSVAYFTINISIMDVKPINSLLRSKPLP